MYGLKALDNSTCSYMYWSRDVSELVYARRDFRSDSRADTGIKMISQVNHALFYCYQGRARCATLGPPSASELF